MQRKHWQNSFLLLAAAAFAAPLAPHAANVVKRRLAVSAAMQLAATSPFQGVVAIQKEILNCNVPFTDDKPPLNTRVRAEAPDGSFSEDISFLDGSIKKRTIYRADGYRIFVFDQIASKSTMRASTSREADTRAGMLDPKSDCLANYLGANLGVQKIGEETMFGQRAIKVLHLSVDSRRTSWRLPNVGCFEVQNFMEYMDPKDHSKVIGTSLVKTDNLTVGPPAGSYFTAPEGYAEHSPTQIAIELLTAKGIRVGKTPEEARKIATDRLSHDPGLAATETSYQSHKVIQ